MNVLTLNNKFLDLNEISNEIDDVQFWVLEYTNSPNTDYFSNPLLFLDIFDDVRLDIKIGPYHFQMPEEFSILCADKFRGDAEILRPTMPGFNEKEFSAFIFNPMSGFKIDYLPVELVTPLPETKWHLPKLKYGQLLAVPLTLEENPPCVFITHQKKNKVPEIINLEYLL